MNILQLCIRVPYPPVDGGSIAMYHMQQSLHENGATLKVLSFNTIKQLADINSLDKDYLAMTRIEGIFLDNRINPFAALFNIFTGESYHIVRFIRRDFEEKLIEILKKEQFDIVQLESLYMIPYIETIRKYSTANVVLRTHNIEHLIWKRLSMAATNPLRKWYLNLLSERLRHYEQLALNKVDAIVAMTPEDVKILRDLGTEVPLTIAPVGVNINEYHPFPKPDPQLVFHIGAMDWLPNQESVDWFLKSIWPIVISKVPQAKLALAGKKMPESVKSKANAQITVSDFVPDGKAFIGRGGIMIVPLLSGSGMRVKIIEGMAMGKAIVTTSIGVEGIPGKNGSEFLLADTAEEFAERVILLLQQPHLQEELGNNARAFVMKSFNNHQIGKDLMTFYEDLKAD
ncbi:MAG: glycosyltransferase [Bacteroidetes bacterium]|nr:glycosyltransferase [Bacteroidota bacterium]